MERGKLTEWELIAPKPCCEFCADNDRTEPATFLAAQSLDQGRTVRWVLVCQDHADGWNDGGDWQAPLYPLAHNPELPKVVAALREKADEMLDHRDSTPEDSPKNSRRRARFDGRHYGLYDAAEIVEAAIRDGGKPVFDSNFD